MEAHTSSDIRLVHRRKKKNIIREVYLYDRMVVKRFIKLAPLPDTRRVWRMEHRALKRLTGLPVSKTYNFIQRKINGATEIIYAREFLEGDPINKFEAGDIGPLAWIMARIHQRGVITRDPHLENFIRAPDGKILFFDFGRALVVHPKNPLIVFLLGKELARILIHSGIKDAGFSHTFLDFYFRFMQISAAKRRWVESLCHLWVRRFDKKRN
jgi:hypothetical protein